MSMDADRETVTLISHPILIKEVRTVLEATNREDQFEQIRVPGINGVFHRAWLGRVPSPKEFVESIEREGGRMLRKGGGQGVTSIVETSAGTCFVKVYRPKRFYRRIRDFFRASRGIREWRSNCRAEEIGVHTAPIIAAFSRRRGFRFFHYFISAPASGRDAAVILRDLKDRGESNAPFLRDVAAYLADLHRRGFWHAHMHCKHLFRADDGTFSLIDLERSMIRSKLPHGKMYRNFRQMRKSLRSLLPDTEVRVFEESYMKAFRETTADAGNACGSWFAKYADFLSREIQSPAGVD